MRLSPLDIEQIFLKKLQTDSAFLWPLVVRQIDEEHIALSLNHNDVWLAVQYGTALQTLVRSTMLDVEPQDTVIITRHISTSIFEHFKNTGVSLIDINGNYLIQNEHFVAIRLDRPNEYPTSRRIKQLFANETGVVARLLALESARTFYSVNDVYQALLERGGEVSLSTVSRALRGLEGELVILKSRARIETVQPDVVLRQLVDNYSPPHIIKTWHIKVPADHKTAFIHDIIQDTRWVWDGATSASSWLNTPLTTPSLLVGADVDHTTMLALEELSSKRFYNTVVHATTDSFPFFDARSGVASPLETLLTLAQGDKRDQELAEALFGMLTTPDHSVLEREYVPDFKP